MSEKEGKEALLIRELLSLGHDYAEPRAHMLLKMFLLLHGQRLTRQSVSVVRQLLSLHSVIMNHTEVK